VLWLHDNPCANVEGYRDIVLHYLPGLAKLDNNVVSEGERNRTMGKDFAVYGVLEGGSQITTSGLKEQQSSLMRR